MIILPTTYLGNLAYFQQLAKIENLGISASEKYVKQTYRNRAIIMSANGTQTLSIPVERPNGNVSLVSELKISYAEDWRKDHLKAFEAAYNRSPYYEFYVDEFELIYQQDYSSLLEFNLALLRFIISKLQLDCQIAIVEEEPELEFKKLVDPKQAPKLDSKPYIQTYSDKYPFAENLSIVDLLFNEGPNSITFLQ